MKPAFPLAVTASLAAVLAIGASAHAGNPNVIVPADATTSAAYRYADMSKEACMKELEDRKIPHSPAGALEGVDAPVRVSGPIHGVSFEQVNRSNEESLNSDTSVLDCRLLLGIDDFTEQLVEQGIEKVGYIGAYRHEEGVIAPGERHPSGLAIDIAWVQKRDGTRLEVQRDFEGHIGAKTCGRGAQVPARTATAARELRKIVCDAASMRIFNLVLTPNYDQGHYNHVHLEVRRNIRWFLVQ